MPSSLELTMGAAFVGGIVQVFLVSLATAQTFIFFKTSNGVHYLNQWAVFVLWALAVLHAISVIHVTFHYLVTRQADIGGPIVWSFLLESSLEALASDQPNANFICNKALAADERNFGTVTAVCPNYLPLEISHVETMAGIAHVQYTWAVKLDFIATSIIDFILSIALVYKLAKASKRLDWTDRSFDVVLAYALNTGIFARLNTKYYFQKSEGHITAVNVATPSHARLHTRREYDQQLHSSPSTSSTNKATINEVGLPLFHPADDHQRKTSIQLMQVKVTKERLADHDDE
ncbi:hypothetical protein VNI00_011088 [Paramarasmius palmivorus]|uniref:Uncharacterized protein n=1 Tax=Paramarasmius palmivorus TaxID=297713 RepID=A0AAW0CGX7_9AGAR